MCSAISHDQLWINSKESPLPACALLLCSHLDDVTPEAYITQKFKVMQCDIDDAWGQP